jgi:Skp family chaperone for outer membrane proteins
MMKRIGWPGVAVGLVVGGVLFTSGGGLQAQSGAKSTGRVASVDVVRVFNESQRQKDLFEELRALQEKLEAEHQTRKQRIDALQATLDVMDPADPSYPKKTQELLEEQINFKNWRDIKQAGMSREVGVWTARIYKEIVATTEQIAQAQGVDLVLYREEFAPPTFDPDQIRENIRARKVVYASPAVDMTQPVVDKLNSDYRAQPRSPMLFVP